MKYFVILFVSVATPVNAGEISPLELRSPDTPALDVLKFAKSIAPEDVTVIDGSKLSVAELLELSVQERANPTRLQCCDWGGSCFPHDQNS